MGYAPSGPIAADLDAGWMGPVMVGDGVRRALNWSRFGRAQCRRVGKGEHVQPSDHS